MKHFLLFVTFLISVFTSLAQLNLQWAKQSGGSSTDRSISMTLDGGGNIITTGIFSGTVDFDPSSSSFTMVSNSTDNMYVCKLDGNGGFVWARQFFCSTTNAFVRPVDICSDASGNLFFTGWFKGTVDFDSGNSSYTVASTGNYDMFICKYSAAGNFQWVKKFGGSECVGNSIAVDGAGNIFTAGFTYGAVDFDPGTGTYTLASAGGVDGFVSKLDASGNFVWAIGISGSDQDFANAVSLDIMGNVLVTGRFRNSVDFDPGSGTYTLSSSSGTVDDIFICKFTNNGSFIWANQIGGANADEGIFISTDSQGNVYSTGKYSSTVDFDPGIGTYTLASSGIGSYLLKLSNSGTFVWAKTISAGLAIEPHSTALDAVNNLYLTGSFSGLTDFDPGPGSYTLTASQTTGFILKLDSLGSFVWARPANLSFYNWIERYGKSIAVDGGRNIYLSGYFSGTVDMDFTSATYTLISSGAEDIFAAKYCQTPENLGSIVGQTLACTGASLIFSINPVSGASSYSWSLPSGMTGSGNSFSLNVLSGGSGGTMTVSAVNSCGNTNSATLGLIVTPSLNLAVNNPVICSAGNATLTASGASSYTWDTGATTNSLATSQSVTTSYTVTGSAAGCTNSTKISTVSVSPVSITLTASSTTLCSGRSATLTATGAPNYSWSNGSASSTLAVTGTTMSSGIFTVKGYNTGCNDTKSISISFYPSPVIVGNSVTVCQGSSFTMTPSGAATYTFSNGSAVASPSINTTYSITGTSTMGCISLSPGLYYANVTPLPTLSVNSGTICSGKLFTLTPSGANSYSFSGGSATVSPNTTTSYSVTGFSLQGCLATNTAIATVTVLPLPIITTNSGSICAGSTFTISPTGGVSYSISGGSATVSPPVGITNFSVTGTDGLGCESLVALSTVTVQALPSVTVNSGAICLGSTFTLNPNGAVNYSYSSNSSTVSPITNTTYSVIGADQHGCISQLAVSNVTVHPLPTVVVNSGTTCAGQTFTMNPSGALTYIFSSVSPTVSPSVTTTYSVTGISPAGCVSGNTAIATVSVIALPVISVNSGSICAGQVFTINPSGATLYTYSSNSNTVSPSSGITSYSVIGSNLYGCESIPAVSTVTTYPLPGISVNSGTICSGETFTILPTGAVNYSFSSGSPIVNPLSNTIYSVQGENIYGCTSPLVLCYVTVRNLPNVIITGSFPSICSGETITLTASGASTYLWTDGQTEPTILISPTTTTQYSVSGSDSYGCVGSSIITQVVETCLGISPQRMPSLKFYPNPVADQLTFEIETHLEFSLVNSSGELITELKLESGKHILNLSEQPNGLYFIIMKWDKTNVITKIIKN